MRQKVMIMCAFLIEPNLYIVDEPFVGLDPLAINAYIQWMERMKKNGAGVLMSTHILATAERYCDRFVILHDEIGRASCRERVYMSVWVDWGEEIKKISGMREKS